MSFPMLKIPDECPEQIEEVFGEFQRDMGFPITPNFMKIQRHSRAAVTGTWGLLQGALLSGSLPRALKDMLIAAVSHDRQCVYCEAAHLACCRSLGIDPACVERCHDR